MFVSHLLMMIMHPTDPRDLLHYTHHRFDFIRRVRDEYDYRYNAIVSHKLRALLASSLTPSTVSVTIAHTIGANFSKLTSETFFGPFTPLYLYTLHTLEVLSSEAI